MDILPSQNEANVEGQNPPRVPRKNFTVGGGFAVVLIGLTIVGCLLVVPRPTYPQILPLPFIDQDEKKRVEALEIRRAEAAMAGTLDHETRAIGEQVRRLGVVLAEGRLLDAGAVRQLQNDVKHLLVRPADGDLSGKEALLQLRALQGQMFLEAVDAWQKTKSLELELKELGGPFHLLAADGWLDDKGRLVLDEDDLRLFFRVHWGKITGASKTHPFEASLEELRRYYLANLLYPQGASTDAIDRSNRQIAFARALGAVDPNYPSLLAQGILELRAGQVLLADQHLRDHLELFPDGPFSALARNHLMLATTQANALVDGDP